MLAENSDHLITLVAHITIVSMEILTLSPTYNLLSYVQRLFIFYFLFWRSVLIFVRVGWGVDDIAVVVVVFKPGHKAQRNPE